MWILIIKLIQKYKFGKESYKKFRKKYFTRVGEKDNKSNIFDLYTKTSINTNIPRDNKDVLGWIFSKDNIINKYYCYELNNKIIVYVLITMLLK